MPQRIIRKKASFLQIFELETRAFKILLSVDDSGFLNNKYRTHKRVSKLSFQVIFRKTRVGLIRRKGIFLPN